MTFFSNLNNLKIMTNLITAKDKVVNSFKKFCKLLREKKATHQTHESHTDYIPIVVWGDIFGNRIYFKDDGIRYFWQFKKYTLDGLMRKLHTAGIDYCSIDISSMVYVQYGNKQNRHYL